MTQIEALLSVDAGRIPPGTVAFFASDPADEQVRLYAIIAAVAGLIAAACGFAEAGPEIIALAILGTVVSTVLALTSESEPLEPGAKRSTVVVTPTGVIMRDACGLRTWTFDDLAAVRLVSLGPKVGLVVSRRDGSRDLIDILNFKGADSLRQLLYRELNRRPSHPSAALAVQSASAES